MKIKIYQVEHDRDTHNVAFMGSDSLEKFQGSPELDSSIYDCVFEGDVNCKHLEDVYSMFNYHHPAGYRARSLSKSDVVEVIEDDKVKPGFYFCDTFGFKEMKFEPDKAKISNRFCNLDEVKTISVLLVQPNKYPRMIQIENSLESMQKTVGGDIEEYMPYEDEVALVCNEEGKMIGLPLNRAIYAEADETESGKREMIDIIAGDFFICYAPITSEKFLSLPPEMAEKYKEQFRYPEKFYRGAFGIIAEPFKPVKADRDR